MEANDYINLFKTILVYTFPLISTISVIANILSFLTFSRKKFQNTVFSIYFRFSLFFDILSAITIPINKLLEFNFSIYFRDYNDSLCKFRYYFIYVLIPISGWILVIVSIDRFVNMAYPNRFLFKNKQSFQITVCTVIFIFNLAYYSPLLSYFIKINTIFNNSTNKTTYSFKCTNYGYPTDLLNIMNTTIVPFSLMFLFTFLTLKTLFKSRRKNNQIRNDQIKKRDVRFTKTSIALNIIFLLFNLPYGVFSILILRYKKFTGPDLEHLLYSIVYITYYSSFGSVFFINLKVNSIFRKEFMKMVLMRKDSMKTANSTIATGKSELRK